MKKLPDEQFELKEACDVKDCPFDEWFPRFRFMLHISLDESLGNEKETSQLATKMISILNDEEIFNPLIVIRACFMVAATAWKRFKVGVESGEYKAVVN